MKCSKCNIEYKDAQLFRIRTKDSTKDELYCANCIKELKEGINKFGFTKDLGYGNGGMTIDTTFYFKVPAKYFANANKVKMTYSHEKEIKDLSLWEKMAKLELVSQALCLSTDNSYKILLDLLLAKDKKAHYIYDSILLISKEEYDDL